MKINSHRLLRRISLVGVLFCATPFASAQLPSRDDFADMSIAELFDVGSEETGWWAMRGMPWPIDELLTRPRNEVVAEAVRRIDALRTGRYVDAFLVTVLLRLNVENLHGILTEHYEKLDDLGKYEVLLHAASTSREGYTRLFVDAVKTVMPEPAINNVAVLAAIYQSVMGEPELHGVLSEYVASHPQPDETEKRSANLDGFPYSDVIARHISDVDELFRQALQIGEYYTGDSAVAMSAEEQQLLGEIRQTLLDPERKSLDIQEQPLIEVLRELGRNFQGFRVSSLSKELQGNDINAAISGTNLSLVDALSQLCNQSMLSILSSLHGNNTWSISPGNRYGYAATNSCISIDGFLISVRPFYSAFRDQPRISLFIRVETPSSWTSYTHVQFLVESVVTEGGIEDELYNSFLPRNGISIPLENQSAESIGAISIKGTVVLSVPISIRQIEFDLKDRHEIDLKEGIRRISYSHTPDEVAIAWGLTSGCCNWRQPPLIDPGNISLIDETGKLPGVASSGLSTPWGSSAGGQLGFRRSERSPWNPARLTWTYAPSVETIRIPVSFENMRLVPKLSDGQ